MNIRKAKPPDKSAIVSFQLAMALETENIELNQKIVGEGVSAVLNDASKGCYFVAEYNGEVISSLMITNEWSDWRNGTIWWIQSVYIKPEFRRKGVYSKMYEHIKSIVETDNSLQGIRLYVDKSNKKAQATYSKLGMDGDHYLTFEWMKHF